MDRRTLLKLGGAACGTTLLHNPAFAAEPEDNSSEFVGVLVDITRCTGCRKCEEACADANHLPKPDITDKSVFEEIREKTPSRYTVVNRYETEKGTFYVKSQCMHCAQAGCASACLVQAMKKTRMGPVIWRGDKCMGCRYCMIACPFYVPKFEYSSANPKVQKCTLCYERLKEGKLPACVEGCPVEALQFGPRRELIEVARARIYSQPDKYVHQIYGEHEVGGTGWLYLSPVPFEQVGFQTNLGTTPIPETTQDFLYSVPLVLFLWPAFLYGTSRITRSEADEAREITPLGDAP